MRQRGALNSPDRMPSQRWDIGLIEFYCAKVAIVTGRRVVEVSVPKSRQ